MTLRHARLPLLVPFALALSAPAALSAQVTEPPPPLPERDVAIPDFEEFTLDNGLEVIFLEHRSQPVTSVALYSRAGSSADPEDRLGLASLTAAVLTQGTESRSADEISETIEGVGASLSASASRDWTTVSTTTLAEHLPLALELVSDVALEPTFPDDEVDLARTRALSSLRETLSQGPALANRRFQREVYGGEHPYGLSRTEETVGAMERDDLVAFHEGAFRPGNALLVVAGDADLAQVREQVEAQFGGWAPGEPVAVEHPSLPEPGERDIALVHRPGSSQSSIVVGHAGVRPDEPDYFALQVLSGILGGGADSRFFRILREEKGWTYGASSSFSRPLDVGTFEVRAEVRPEVTDSTVAEVFDQLERIREEEVPSDEFEGAVNYLAGSFPLQIQTASHIASRIARDQILGLPREEFREYPSRIRSVTPEDVQSAARTHVRPEDASVVVVADAPAVIDELEALGPVRLYDAEGRTMAREDVEEAPAAVVDGSRLQETRRTYAFTVQGMEQGSVEYTLRQVEDVDGAPEGEAVWESRSVMSSPGVEQEQILRFTAADLTPLHLTQDASQAGASIQAEVNVVDGHLTGHAALPPQAGGDQDFDQELPEGALLSGMDEYLLAASELADGDRVSAPMLELIQGEVTTMTFQVDGTDTLETEAGSFETFRVRVEGPQPMTLYVRRDAPHVVIRQEYDGQPVTLELTSLEEGSEVF